MIRGLLQGKHYYNDPNLAHQVRVRLFLRWIQTPSKVHPKAESWLSSNGGSQWKNLLVEWLLHIHRVLLEIRGECK